MRLYRSASRLALRILNKHRDEHKERESHRHVSAEVTVGIKPVWIILYIIIYVKYVGASERLQLMLGRFVFILSPYMYISLTDQYENGKARVLLV